MFTEISDQELDDLIAKLTNPENEAYLDSDQARATEASNREYFDTLAYIRSF